MPTDPISHFVFVDFENVPNVNLALVAILPVQVTLLIGKNQKSTDMELTEQIHRQAHQVKLMRTGASGHNALDLILCFYLGQSVQKHPDAQFHIVSKDKDFDPLIGHLYAKGVKVARCDSFGALPFLPAHKKPPIPPVKSPVDRRAKVMARLQSPSSSNRPSSRQALLAYLKTALGKTVSDIQVEEFIAELVETNILTIDSKNKVSYQAKSRSKPLL